MEPLWIRSSRCETGQCVEVLYYEDGSALIRNSGSGEQSPVLRFPVDEWLAFLAGVKAGEFDPL